MVRSTSMLTRKATGNILLIIWIIACLLGIICLPSCTKDRPCPPDTANEKYQEQFDQGKIN